MVIVPLPSASPAVHVDRSVLCRAMLIIFITSSTVTAPTPLQSPTQGFGVGVIVGVAVAVAVRVGLAVTVGLTLGV